MPDHPHDPTDRAKRRRQPGPRAGILILDVTNPRAIRQTPSGDKEPGR